jgi:hypothetical protein
MSRTAWTIRRENQALVRIHLSKHLPHGAHAAARRGATHHSITHTANRARNDLAITMTRDQDGKIAVSVYRASGWHVLMPHGIDAALSLLAT